MHHQPMHSAALSTLHHDSADHLLLTADSIAVRDGERILIHDVSLSIHEGEILTIIGPNGAGKTTLLKTLLGLRPLSSGQISRAPGLKIGYMPQALALNPMLPMTVQRFLQQTGADNTRIGLALTETGVQDLSGQSLHKISGGELQRVLLARALLRQPQLLVLDEPAQGVDMCGQADLYRLIAELRNRHHCGVLLVSHDLHLVMAATDTVICLNQHICCQGHPEHVSQHPEYLQLFGRQIAEDIAVYTHHHDHDHTLRGEVVSGCQHGSHSHSHPHAHGPGCQHD